MLSYSHQIDALEYIYFIVDSFLFVSFGIKYYQWNISIEYFYYYSDDIALSDLNTIFWVQSLQKFVFDETQKVHILIFGIKY